MRWRLISDPIQVYIVPIVSSQPEQSSYRLSWVWSITFYISWKRISWHIVHGNLSSCRPYRELLQVNSSQIRQGVCVIHGLPDDPIQNVGLLYTVSRFNALQLHTWCSLYPLLWPVTSNKGYTSSMWRTKQSWNESIVRTFHDFRVRTSQNVYC